MVVAADLHDHRLRSVREQLRKQKRTTSRCSLSTRVPRSLPSAICPHLGGRTCSGTGGTLARNPEIRWRLAPQDLANAHARQTAVLRQALTLLAPGGRLVYATCSLEPEENEQVVDDAPCGCGGSRRRKRPRNLATSPAPRRPPQAFSIATVSSGRSRPSPALTAFSPRLSNDAPGCAPATRRVGRFPNRAVSPPLFVRLHCDDPDGN